MGGIHQDRLVQFVPVSEVFTCFQDTDPAAVMVAFDKNQDAVELEFYRITERLSTVDADLDVISGERIALGDKPRISRREVRLLEIR